MSNTDMPPNGYDKIRKEHDWIEQVQPCVGIGGLHSGQEKFLQNSSGSRTQIFGRKVRRKDDGPLTIFCGWIVRHQIGLSLNLLILLALTHLCLPRARRHTRKFFELSYYNEQTGEYRAGWDDAWMVLYWIVVFTGLRAAVLDYVLTPLAQLGGILNKKDVARFGEQGWLLVYYSVFWTLGMYILYNSPYWLNLRNLWTDWPNRELGGLQKWYILVQFAFWLQQIMVINIEKRRKDHWQMFSHHIITCTLIFNAYAYHQFKVANLILCIMDVVDIFLPIAKCLKYLGHTTACDFAFAIFMLIWFAARHVIYMLVCYSIYHDLPLETTYGCYKGRKGAMLGPFNSPNSNSNSFQYLIQPFTDPEGVICFNNSIKWAFLTPLLLLQGITIMWFCMICRVAIRVVKGGLEAEDPRSDDEDEMEVEDELEEDIETEYYYNDKLTQASQLPLATHTKIPVSSSNFGSRNPSPNPNLVSTTTFEASSEAPLEEEVGVESINFKNRRIRSPSRLPVSSNSGGQRAGGKKSSSSGVHIPGGIARKELLDRIGCERPIE